MSAELLREAADRLDALADAAIAGPWVPSSDHQTGPTVLCFEGERNGEAWWGQAAYTETDDDAAYIAAMSPTVGKALAAWLRASAVRADLASAFLDTNALAVARAILGGAS